jgi:hypothetical protein
MARNNKLPDEIPYNKFKHYTAAEWREHCLNYKRNTTPAERMARLLPGWVFAGGRWVQRPLQTI